MDYFRNTLTTSFLNLNQPHSDDIALDDMEAGSTSIQYAHPHIAHPLDPDSSANNTVANPASSSSMLIPLLPSPKIGTNLGVNNKRSHSDDGPTKVRVVEQTSNMPAIRMIGKKFQDSFEKTTREYEKTEKQLDQTKKQLDRVGQRLAEANQRADDATKQAEESRAEMEKVKVWADDFAKRYDQKADEQHLVTLARAEETERMAAKIKEAEERIRKSEEESRAEIERVKVWADDRAKRSEDLNQKANEQHLVALAHAEEAEQRMAAKMKEADERIRKAEENASQLEKKFMDMVKQVHGSTASNREQMNVDVASNKDAWQSWRSEEDKAGSVNLGMGESDVEENSVTEILNENMVPASTEDDGETGMSTDDQDRTEVKRGKQKEVPPPTKFARPPGGASSVVLRMQPVARNRVQYATPSVSPEPTSLSTNQYTASPGPQRYQHAGSPGPSSKPSPHHRHRPRRGKEPIFGESAEESRSNRPSSRNIYPQSTLRGFTVVKAGRLTSVRESMNRLMHINKDKDISQIDCPTEVEVEEFNEGTGAGPEIDPMRPYLNSNKQTSWNDALCELFVKDFEEEQEIKLTPDEKETVEIMFLDRLGRLVRPWRESRNFTEEELYERERHSQDRARKNTRRVDLYNERLAICQGNLMNRDGSIDLGWKTMDEMVVALGPAGMSSDESEVDEETKKTTYRIKRRLWRATICRDRLKLVDSDRNIINAHGGTRPGKQPRERIRSSTATISKRAPTVGCPKNFYSREWVANLGSERMVRALKRKPEKDLGSIQDD